LFVLGRVRLGIGDGITGFSLSLTLPVCFFSAIFDSSRALQEGARREDKMLRASDRSDTMFGSW
jgi:hypothetical protein